MSQTVTRLKELLFDNEAQVLADLTRRLELLAQSQTASRAELKAEVDAIMARVGDPERLTISVADIIDDALRRAEVSKHSELSISIAPLVVTTIKAELKNSQDEMVEALYPITGRLVKSYVASAIKDLAEDMNRKLEQNAVMLRLQSLTTGRSVGEIALASTQDFKVLELFLIRRGSGELVAHWPQEAGGREHLMSGVLAAVNAFANEAFSAAEGALRQIDLGEETIYLRGSQLYLLAAKCSGTAPKDIEQTLDEAFLATIEKKLSYDAVEDPTANRQLITDLGTHVTSRIDERKKVSRKSGLRPLKVLATLILLPLLGWLSWSYYVEFANENTRAAAQRVVEANATMKGYPAHLEATRAGRLLRVSGLAPSQTVKDEVLKGLGKALPTVAVRDELSVVPGSDITIPDTEPKFEEVRRAVRELQAETERSVVARLTARAATRLEQARADLITAQSAFPADNAAKRELVGKVAAATATIAADIQKVGQAGTTASESDSVDEMATLSKRLVEQSNALAAVSGTAKEPTVLEPANNVSVAVETLAAMAERHAALASVIAASSVLRPVQIQVPVPVEKAPPPDPRQVIETFAARNAIFFSNGADYRNSDAARQTLDALVPLIRNANALVRVVGYTDVAGSVPGNASLAQVRADKVRQELLARGAPPNLVVAVGRRDVLDLSNTQGPDSPNRRVTFEIGYAGEAGR